MTTVTTRTVEYPADGLTMIGHLALPTGVGRRPAVLLGPEGTGIEYVQRRRADALAELGYVALAFDIHGGRWFTDPEEMLARCMPLLADPDRMRDIGHAALDVLRAEPRTDPDRIAAIGYGTGGAIAVELGRAGVELRAIGTVNGLITGRPGEAARIRCPVWAGVGSEDPIQPPAQRDAFADEMQAAGVDWRIVVYGGAQHAFHHPMTRTDQTLLPGVGYHPRHAQRAWRTSSNCSPSACPYRSELAQLDAGIHGGPGRSELANIASHQIAGAVDDDIHLWSELTDRTTSASPGTVELVQLCGEGLEGVDELVGRAVIRP
jgi:dienelactone hydrolase